MKGEINNNTVIVGDFNTPLTSVDRSTKQKINKDQTQRTNIKSSKGEKKHTQITHKGIPIRITADLSIETLQARREWQDILKVKKENNYSPDYCTQQ